jgi:acyl-CoA hydrolase
VALGPDGKPRPVPEIVPEGDDEKRRYVEAEARRAERLRLRLHR